MQLIIINKFAWFLRKSFVTKLLFYQVSNVQLGELTRADKNFFRFERYFRKLCLNLGGDLLNISNEGVEPFLTVFNTDNKLLSQTLDHLVF